MEYIIGVSLALAVSILARVIGFDRDRAFYPTMTIVIASYYGLFAVFGGSRDALAVESAIIVGFVAVAALGFRFNLWVLVAALFAHGIFDFFHGHVISNPGVPQWWPMFCLTYDITAAGVLAWLLRQSKIAVKPSKSD